jgi:hypothetical protein
MLIRSPGYMAELDAHMKAEKESTKIENELREKAEARQLIGKEAIHRETHTFLMHATIGPYSGSKNPSRIKYFISEILRISERFSLNDTQLITLSGRNMTGRAEEWFHAYRCSAKCRDETFQQFTHHLIHHFAGADDKQQQVEDIVNLKQNNRVIEYSSHFESFLQKLPKDFFTEEQKVIFYISGLKPKIKIEVQHEHPLTLIEAIEISQVYENIIKVGSFGNNQVKKTVELDPQRKVECRKYSDQNERTGHDEMKIGSVNIEYQGNKKYICYNCSKEGHFASQCLESALTQNVK